MAERHPGVPADSFPHDEDVTSAPGALVVGGDYRGLGIVRSLGRRGIPVWVLGDDHLIAGTSRYAGRRLSWPHRGDDATKIAFLLDLAMRHDVDGWVVFPTGDETAALLARHYDVLRRWFRLTVPPWDILRWAYDKRLTHQLAADVGVDYPRTFYPESRRDLATPKCRFPVILKPTVKKGFNRFTHAKAWRADDVKALLSGYDAAREMVSAEVIMVQELIPGGGETQFSFAALCQDGDPLASVTARRTRQYPVDFGRASTFVETVACADVEEPSRRLLAAMRYTGLVEIEFKLDPRDGRYKLLDLNPRAWGWHALGRRAGVDFPYLAWQLTRGETVPKLRGRPGARWIRLIADLPAAVTEIRHGRLSPATYLRSLRGSLEFATFAFDDPLPALMDVPLLCYLAWRRGAI